MAVALPSTALHASLTALVQRRHSQFDYLARVLNGTTLHLNTVRLSFLAVQASLPPATLEHRCHTLALFGLSVSRLVGVSDTVAFVNELTTLIHEWHDYDRHHNRDEWHYTHTATGKHRHIHATLHRQSLLAQAHTDSDGDSGSGNSRDAGSDSISNKYGKYTVLTSLLIPSSHSLTASSLYSLAELVASMFELLPLVYAKFLAHPSDSWTVELMQRVLLVDRRIREEIVVPLIHDLTHASLSAVTSELAAIGANNQITLPKLGAL